MSEQTEPQWPRIRDLPEAERSTFLIWLTGQTCPCIEGEPDDQQDGYYSHDYDRWKHFQKFGREVMD